MKTSEIMLGDYFNVYPSNLPIKVAAIHKGKVGYHARIGKLAWVRADLLRPIPMTTGILRKNGFAKIGDYDTHLNFILSFIHDDDDDIIIVEYRIYKEPICGVNTLLRCEVNFKGGVDKIHSCHIEYLHELQHALRLCGIEKTITL